jgi:nicotinamide riboside transporter PnuC
MLAVIWTVIAVLFDYLFIVKAFKPADGYYKPDVYLYYALTFIVPLLIGWWKKSKSS